MAQHLPAHLGAGDDKVAAALAGAAVGAGAAGEAVGDVDLLRLLVGVKLLLDTLGDLKPGHRHVARPKFASVHQGAVAKLVPLLGGSV